MSEKRIKVIIYSLINPENQKVFYVGRTSTSLKVRLFNHIRDGRKAKGKKGAYISAILEKGLLPSINEIVFLINPTEKEIHETEQAWIDYFSLTCNLLNIRDSRIGSHYRHGSLEITNELIAEFGRLSDMDLAKKYGVSNSTIGYHRRKLGISNCPQYNRSNPPNTGGWNKIIFPDSIIDRLGKNYDFELAEEMGVNPEVIGKLRRRLGIARKPPPPKGKSIRKIVQVS